MASSTLDPDNIPEPDRQLGKGHSIDALGPSDISDTGSDEQAGVRAIEGAGIGLDRGTNEDSDSHNLDMRGDTDSTGTGESSTAGRNEDVEIAGDINVDQIDEIAQEDDADLDAAIDAADRELESDDAIGERNARKPAPGRFPGQRSV